MPVMLAYKADGEKPTMDMDKVYQWVDEGRTVYCRKYFAYGRGGGEWAYNSKWKVWREGNEHEDAWTKGKGEDLMKDEH